MCPREGKVGAQVMSRIRSALKRHRQSLVRRERNRRVRSSLRTAIKKLLACVESGDVDKARERLPLVVKAIDKAATKGVIHKRKASRLVSRLSKKVWRLGAASAAEG